MRRRIPRPAFAMLLALLVMAGVTAIATGLARSSLTNIFTSRDLNDTVLAYFAAESGIERGLAIAQLYREQSLPLTGPGGLQQRLNNLDVTMRTARYAGIITMPPATTSAPIAIAENRAVAIDILDPDSFSSGAGVKSVRITTASGSSTNAPWLEATFTKYLPGATGIILDPIEAVDSYLSSERTSDPAITYNTRLSTATCVSPAGCCLSVLAATHSYRLRLTALYGTASRVQVTAYDDVNCPNDPARVKDLKSQIVIQSTGRALTGLTEVRPVLSATANWLIPSSPLFDYTLFSEQPIEKR